VALYVLPKNFCSSFVHKNAIKNYLMDPLLIFSQPQENYSKEFAKTAKIPGVLTSTVHVGELVSLFKFFFNMPY